MPTGSSDEAAIEIASNERAYIVGRTRSGKTYLARYLLRSCRRLLACDPKGGLDDWRLEPWNPQTREALADGKDVRIRVTRQPGSDPVAWWESVLAAAYEAGDLVVYIDEVYLLSRGEGTGGYPIALRDIWTQGAGQGIGGFAVSQRPRFVPKYLLSEAEHAFLFRLVLPADREAVAEWTHERLAQPIPRHDRHGFWYMSIDRDEPIYIPRLHTGRGEGWGQLSGMHEEDSE